MLNVKLVLQNMKSHTNLAHARTSPQHVRNFTPVLEIARKKPKPSINTVEVSDSPSVSLTWHFCCPHSRRELGGLLCQVIRAHVAFQSINIHQCCFNLEK